MRGVSSIRFANARDGWVFGPSLWSTHDDGATWNEIQLSGFRADSIQQLEVVGSVVAAVGSTADQVAPAFRLAESAIGGDDWHAVGSKSEYGAGPEPTPTLVSTHGMAWFMQVDRVPVDGSRRVNGAWQAWQPPCADEGGPAVLAAASATALAAACQVGAWGPSAHGFPFGGRLFTSSDGGTRFDPVGDAMPIDGARSIAMATPSVIVVAGPGESGDELLRSGDGGKTWAVVAQYDGRFVRYLGFTTATQGVLLLDTSTNGFLMTHDAGLTWQAVHF
ncbi:MAG: hypothetical protein HY263_03600 [Chloroflexi bacterium]|nr:hypothetical protein [Chloroflexota bacterium]